MIIHNLIGTRNPFASIFSKLSLKPLVLSLFVCFSLFAVGQEGNIDPNFDAGGNANQGGTITYNQYPIEYLFDVEVLPDRSIIGAGVVGSLQYFVAAAVKLTEDGSINTDFAIDGGAYYDFMTGSSMSANKILPMAGGGFYLGGTSIDRSSNESFCLIKYLENGRVDGSFNQTGLLVENFSSEDFIRDLIFLPGDRVLAGGRINNNFGMVSYLPNGDRDTSFNHTGKKEFNLSAYDFVQRMHLLSETQILLVGQASSNLAFIWTQTDGSLDTTINPTGWTIANLGGSVDVRSSVILPNDKILVTGGITNGNNTDVFVSRFLPNGALDTTFANQGTYRLDVGGTDNANDMALQPDGKIVWGGGSTQGFSQNFLIGRLQGNGQADSTFAAGGYTRTFFPNTNTVGYALTIQEDGKILMVGVAGSFTQTNFALARYLGQLNVGMLDFSEPMSELLVYPNPIQNRSLLQFELNQPTSLSLTLVNRQGQLIHRFFHDKYCVAGSHEEELQFPWIAAGQYFLMLSDGKQTTSISIQKVD